MGIHSSYVVAVPLSLHQYETLSLSLSWLWPLPDQTFWRKRNPTLLFSLPTWMLTPMVPTNSTSKLRKLPVPFPADHILTLTLMVTSSVCLSLLIKTDSSQPVTIYPNLIQPSLELWSRFVAPTRLMLNAQLATTTTLNSSIHSILLYDSSNRISEI